jgi:hypothetical protein
MPQDRVKCKALVDGVINFQIHTWRIISYQLRYYKRLKKDGALCSVIYAFFLAIS